ncbi:MAG: tRNA (adenosine(37)-N6)-threonylcarbamoyltransferase complex dimerization subunit type 1 TsaB [Hyphomicrobiaceae bacterium]
MLEQPGNILAFDTTFGACSAALRVSATADRRPQHAERFETMSSGHAERLMTMIAEVMGEAHLDFTGLDGLAVTVGPGTFTGTRVGIAAARGLSFATGLPVFGTTSLALLAAAAGARTAIRDDVLPARIAVCKDARRGQVYRQDFQNLKNGPNLPPWLATVEEAATELRAYAGATWLAGDAAQLVFDEVGTSPLIKVAESSPKPPSAIHIFDVHLTRLESPEPLYLRAPDAKPQIDKVDKLLSRP